MNAAVTEDVNGKGSSLGLVVKHASQQTKKSPHALTHEGWW
jgi:hypothetical protein